MVVGIGPSLHSIEGYPKVIDSEACQGGGEAREVPWKGFLTSFGIPGILDRNSFSEKKYRLSSGTGAEIENADIRLYMSFEPQVELITMDGKGSDRGVGFGDADWRMPRQKLRSQTFLHFSYASFASDAQARDLQIAMSSHGDLIYSSSADRSTSRPNTITMPNTPNWVTIVGMPVDKSKAMR
jgi:hypothetical protein